jgi:hypothetical protein
MLVTSLSTLLEEAAADPDIKRLEGNIKSFEQLLDADTAHRLELIHDGTFAFVAFHPLGDPAVTAYLTEGTLSSDSGDQVLCLFTLNVEARAPTVIGSEALGSVVEIGDGIQAAQQLVRDAFAPKPAPPLPGILFFPTLTQATGAAYLSLSGLTTAQEVRERLRLLFGLAERATRRSHEQGQGPMEFMHHFGVALTKAKLPYETTERRSMHEWLVRSYQAIWEHRGDIVAVAGVL